LRSIVCRKLAAFHKHPTPNRRAPRERACPTLDTLVPAGETAAGSVRVMCVELATRGAEVHACVTRKGVHSMQHPVTFGQGFKPGCPEKDGPDDGPLDSMAPWLCNNFVFAVLYRGGAGVRLRRSLHWPFRIADVTQRGRAHRTG